MFVRKRKGPRPHFGKPSDQVSGKQKLRVRQHLDRLSFQSEGPPQQAEGGPPIAACRRTHRQSHSL